MSTAQLGRWQIREYFIRDDDLVLWTKPTQAYAPVKPVAFELTQSNVYLRDLNIINIFCPMTSVHSISNERQKI